MSLRMKHRVWVNTSRNTDMSDLVYGPAEADRLVQHDAFDQWGGGSIKIAASGNEDLSLIDVENVKGIYLEVAGDAQVKLNGSSDVIQLRRYSAETNVVAKLFLEGDITQVNITETGGTDALVGHYHIWGSAT